MTNKLTQHLKGNGQDFEHYPTKPEMLHAIRRHAVRTLKTDHFTVLDIGAGRGDAGLEIAGDEGKSHTIELSPILRSMQPKRCTPISVDFETTTLLDKEHYPVVFCNPPYSRFVDWMEKIIREVSADLLYIVVPRRWEDNALIQQTIRSRQAAYEILLEDDFIDAERSARAKVHVVAIDLCRIPEQFTDRLGKRQKGSCRTDPFEQWLLENFAPASEPEQPESEQAEPQELVQAPSFVVALVENYNGELQKTTDFYRMLSKFTLAELKDLLPSGASNAQAGWELISSSEQLMKTLRLKIFGLKKTYWKRLFDSYLPPERRITTDARSSIFRDKLTCWSRRDLLYRLTGAKPYNADGTAQTGGDYKTHATGKLRVDFNLENARMVTAWVCEQSNEYFDRQAVELYKDVLTFANTQRFKSNQRVFEKEHFRWQVWNDEVSHVALKPDVRFILENKGHVDHRGVSPVTLDFLDDIRAVARNLGFVCEEASRSKQFSSGKNTEFLYPDGRIFMLTKPHLSGTLHIKADPAFLKAWTILVSRLEGWVKSPEEFKSEVGKKYDLKEINKYWLSGNPRITQELISL